jgi:hypothetical protein
MSEAVPKWAMDLVIALQEWEENGHQLREEWSMEDVKAACHHAWLALIPSEVQEHAAAISAYVRAGTPSQ